VDVGHWYRLLNFKMRADARLHVTPTLVYTAREVEDHSWERVAVEVMKGRAACLSSCRKLYAGYLSLFVWRWTILRWKVVLKLELLQSTNTPSILQLWERSHAGSPNVNSFQIVSFHFFLIVLTCYCVRIFVARRQSYWIYCFSGFICLL
jgi:hypothetical protein